MAEIISWTTFSGVAALTTPAGSFLVDFAMAYSPEGGHKLDVSASLRSTDPNYAADLALFATAFNAVSNDATTTLASLGVTKQMLVQRPAPTSTLP